MDQRKFASVPDFSQPSLEQLNNPTGQEDDQPVSDQVANHCKNDKKRRHKNRSNPHGDLQNIDSEYHGDNHTQRDGDNPNDQTDPLGPS